MADTKQAEGTERARNTRSERKAARLAKQITAFARSHGGSAEGQIAYLGQRGVRIVLVGANGEWGDLVAESHDIATAAVERAGITLHEEFDGEFAARVRTGPYEWSRMAGSQLGGPSND
ncbi:hypothetical protein [Streptomyces alkaliterrae]|uniref:Uncharacterized protein n=1 Tax=Streptomyces alkaliterrae TaxID=2213162 RepID=A0A5P0YL20_9ACTN|nr:hypothetical protein [Streptomyces alkaliterrae]MBB1253979.1 hypothetical protein [Streptomyces alkaliterrae]MBB1260076.1 hypothetical protein [Streptomyces alkaliterrae]MQS00911.1 hypothetical protein [Streptomyces alkaliterrae]